MKYNTKCLICKGRNVMAGQAFTKYTCNICKGEFWHHNTDIPKVCPLCAEVNGLCVCCGSEIK